MSALVTRIRYALRSARRQRLRTVALVAGVALTTALAAAIACIDLGVRDATTTRAGETRLIVYRENRTQLWRKKRDEELTAADKNMIFKYTLAVVLGRNFNIRSPAIKKALQRLAFFTDLLGDPKMQEYTQPVEQNAELKFKYENGMFQKTRPGMVVEPEVSVAPPPLPVLIK